MFLFVAVILLWTGLIVNSERHSLYYIYTGLSKPSGLPSIHEFTAMGQLDGMLIDYYDSEHNQKVPKQNWMKDKLDPSYWIRGTQSRVSKQQWFKVNIEILMQRTRVNDSNVHVLQWMHGCVGEKEANGTLTFRSAVDTYSYDGYDFIAFDCTQEVWVSGIEAAQPTKRKWDGVNTLKEYTKGYLMKECMDWLNIFVKYSQKQLETASPPDVFVFPKSIDETRITLTCLVTGLYSKDITLNIKKNGRVLYKEDGVLTFGVRPNDDDTFQRRDYVELLSSDTDIYTCEVIQRASGLHVEKQWDRELYPVHGKRGFVIHGLVIAGVFVSIGLIAMGAVLIIVYTKCSFLRCMSGTNASRNVSMNTVSVAVSGGVVKVHGSVTDDTGSDRPLNGCSCLTMSV